MHAEHEFAGQGIEVAVVEDVFDEFGVPAEAGILHGQFGNVPAAGVGPEVGGVESQGRRNGGDGTFPCFLLDLVGSVFGDIVDILLLISVDKEGAQIIGNGQTELDVAAGGLPGEVGPFPFRLVHIEPQGQIPVQEIGVQQTYPVGAALAPQGGRQVQFQGLAHEIFLGYGTLQQQTVRRREARPDTETARWAFLDIDFNVHQVLFGAAAGGQVHLVEKAQIVDAAAAFLDARGTVEVALAELHMPADDLVTGTGVSGNADAADANPAALFDLEGDIDLSLLLIHLGQGGDVDEGITLIGIEVIHYQQVFAQGQTAEHIPRTHANLGQQFLATDQQITLDIQGADEKLRAFLDFKQQLDGFLVILDDDLRLSDAGLDIALVEILVGQQIHVHLRHFLPIGAALGQKGQEPFFLGQHGLFQFPILENRISLEPDIRDVNRRTFGDGEGDGRLPLVVDLNLGRNFRRIITGLHIGLFDGLDAVAKKLRLVEIGALGLDQFAQFFVLQLLVAGEIDLPEQGPLFDLINQPLLSVAFLEQSLDVGEATGLEDGLNVPIDILDGQFTTGSGRQNRFDIGPLHPAIAFNDNPVHLVGLRISGAGQHQQYQAQQAYQFFRHNSESPPRL